MIEVAKIFIEAMVGVCELAPLLLMCMVALYMLSAFIICNAFILQTDIEKPLPRRAEQNIILFSVGIFLSVIAVGIFLW